MTSVIHDPALDLGDDRPMRPTPSRSTGDRVFRAISATAALTSGIVVVVTVYSLVKESGPAFHASGIWHFFLSANWNTGPGGKLGVLGLLGGTVIIGLIAVIFGAPLGVMAALFINEYAPARLRKPFTSAIDLLAALPSVLFGLWGFFALRVHLIKIGVWFNRHLSIIPAFRLSPKESVAPTSSFVIGIVVGLMVLPIITAVSREVMAQVPRDQCEAALALGGTRWGMIRDVILPASRSGIASSVVLGLGRAFGETMAVVLLISLVYKANPHVLSAGASSIAALIVINFGTGTKVAQSGLIAAGFALFLLTLVVSFAAKAIVARSGKLK